VKATIRRTSDPTLLFAVGIEDESHEVAVIHCRRLYIDGREFDGELEGLEISRVTIFKDSSVLLWRGSW
jgi:hypothetical protein